MFRWFAPLLLFAAKPEVMVRLLVAALAAAVLFFGVWLISSIAVTFDTLKNPAVAVIYGAVRVELRRPSSDVGALASLLRRALVPAGAPALRFERAP